MHVPLGIRWGTRCTLGIAALLHVICCQGAAYVKPDANAERQIRERGAQHAEAWRQNDATRAASSYAEGAVLSFPDAPDAQGRSAVRELLAGLFTSTHMDSLQIAPDTIEVYGNVAYEWGTYHEVYRPQGKSPVREDGRYVMRWARQPGGEWQISRFTGNSLRRSAM